tara:strand:+ start:1461 stop:2744 length:1284 start_codon:yes stop_codon:yes gene_type:complete
MKFVKTTQIIIIICLLFLNNAFAINLHQAIDLTLSNSKKYKIEKLQLKSAKNNQKTAISEFLPDISANIQRGKKQNIRSDGSGNEDFLIEETNSLSLTQPIFNGMRGIAGIKQGKFEYLAQKYRLENSKRELILEIVTNYFEIITLEKNLKLLNDNANYYRQILNKTKSKGRLTSQNEIIDNKIGYYNAKRDLEDLTNKLNQAKLEFENLTGGKPENLENIDIKLPNIILDNLLNKKDQNPEILQKQNELNAIKQVYRKEIGNLSPKVNITANYSKQENLVYLDGGDLESKSISLDVKIPLFKKGSEYFGIKKAKYDLRIKKEEFHLTSLEIKKKISQSFKEYNSNKRIYEDSTNILSLSRQKLKRNQRSYNLRAISLINLLQIKIEKNNSAIKFYDAKNNLYKSYYKLKLLTEALENTHNKEGNKN